MERLEENTPGRYVTVYQPRGNAEASLWKERLKAEGIKAEIINENAAMTHNALIELQVREKDAPKAYEILKEAPGNSVKPVSLWQLIFGFFGSAVLLTFGILLLTVSPQPKSFGIFVTVSSSLYVLLNFYILKNRKSKTRTIKKD